ncbi:MAG: geranylgeranylglycerol-phosphate geranylgeranyltransferase [Flavobacteriales bacterium]
MMALATIFIAASGNVVNDIFDQDIDFHNKPDKIIVGKTVSEAKAWNLYYGLGSVGLGLGMFLCWQLGNVSNSLLFMLTAGGLYFYSHTYKRQLLIGNVVVALLAGLVPFLPLYIEMMCNPNGWMSLPWSGYLMAFAVFSAYTTIIREMVKDMEDIKGDTLMRCSTLPIVFGLNGSKAVASALLLLLIGTIGWFQMAWFADEQFLLLGYFSVAVQVPALLALVQILRGKTSSDFHKASIVLKLLMLGGIFSMVVFRIVVT